jgi:hypothetical protein
MNTILETLKRIDVVREWLASYDRRERTTRTEQDTAAGYHRRLAELQAQLEIDVRENLKDLIPLP